MLHFQVMGNLAADAEVKNFSSGDYVSFRVAHNFREGDFQKTQWISCLMRGSGGSLLDYLKKGQFVYVTGRGAARVFSSHVTKQFEVGLDLHVDRLELLPSRPKISVEAVKNALEDGLISENDLREILVPEDEKPFE